MKGRGKVTGNEGKQVAVQYELDVYQDDIPAGNLLDPSATIPGLKRFEGWVLPVCFFAENGLLLEMQDGRKLKFAFTDSQGAIALNQWIG